ncbi:MAG: LON peptidase substrate-binding domain-containing protein [Burkholderiaceae bacterium]|nr:LON peptidase substrate-binding domain-containing protein [Burkholderiaceae bacterium]
MTNSLTLNSLPLFPLGTVLFPGGLLPLRIFEVRYLDMIGKCQSTSAPFGVVCLTQGGEVRRPGIQDAFEDVGTLATIEHLESPQPGLLSIRCAGTQRFRITHSEQLKHGLWTASVQLIDDDRPVPVPPDLQGTADALARLVHSLEARERPAEDMPLRGPWQLDDCGWVANRWCEMLPLPLQMRQRMMALDNPLVRLELVSDLLARSGIA